MTLTVSIISHGSAGVPHRSSTSGLAADIGFFDAVRVLIDQAAQSSPADAEEPAELLARVTHWLHDPKRPPIGLTETDRAAWIKALAAHFPKFKSHELRLHYRDSGVDSGIPFPPSAKPAFDFVDLFAGIGGFRLALQGVQGRCVFSSEWDAHAKDTYFANFADMPFGDIRQFTGDHIDDATLATLIPDHDLLAAGFPCQPFSRAGVSARRSLNQLDGFACQTQGTLFFDIIRIASIKRPKVLLLENVKNLRSHDSGRTFELIKRSVEEIGYSFASAVIDSSPLVPQRRQRCYMVCIEGTRKPFEFDLRPFLGPQQPLRLALEPHVGREYTISDRLWLGHQQRTQRNLARGAGFTALEANVDRPANTLVARYGKDGKECLVPQEGANPRMLTPRECARLQGFPEAYRISSSRTSAYRQFGNSVAVPVVSELGRQVVPYLEGKE